MITFWVRFSALWVFTLAVYGAWSDWATPDIAILSALSTVLGFMRVAK